MKYTDPQSPSSNYVNLISSLPRRTASIITQLCTGHIPLNNYLFHINRAPSSICPACHQSNETIIHYLMHCPAYHIPRQSLRYKIDNSNFNICHLLTKLEPLKALTRYIAQTHRFARPRNQPTTTASTASTASQV